MPSEKQLVANQKNAQQSTGPLTIEGKAVVSCNAIKHGIFTQDVILSSKHSQETSEDYLEILNNLIGCLAPQNQLEALLVEKIATDFWRLRRVMRFETASISQCIQQLFAEFYDYTRKNSDELDEMIEAHQESIEWNTSYIASLEAGSVCFDHPVWEGLNLESDILKDLSFVALEISELTSKERDRVQYGELSFSEMKVLVARYGYASQKAITARLIELYTAENQKLQQEIEDYQENKKTNVAADRLHAMLGGLPCTENSEKVLKYEHSLQRSIYQNVLMLRKLQGMP